MKEPATIQKTPKLFEGEGRGELINIFSKMEDDQVFIGNDNSALNDGNIQNLPGIVAQPAVEYEEEIWDEDHLLPLANVISTMRRVLPADAGVPSNVAEIIQRGTSDFILLVTCQARERCRNERRQKIRGDDIIWALEKLGFTNYVAPLELYLSRYQGMHSGDSMASSNMKTQSEASQKQKEQ